MTDAAPTPPAPLVFTKQDAFALVQACEALAKTIAVQKDVQGHDGNAAVQIQFGAGKWPTFLAVTEAARAKLGPDPTPAPPA